jgi:hypothetical protein
MTQKGQCHSKKNFVLLFPKRRGGMPAYRTTGKHQSKGKMEQKEAHGLYWRFHRKDSAGMSKHLGLAGLNNHNKF